MITHKPQQFIYPDYISPLPADEFIKAAVKKQEMYDQGLAQVQTMVDGYAQLRNSMLTDEEKKYFDDNMMNLVKEINNNAGLDFSFNQNVTAVMGLGRQLENNPYISNAVSNGKEVQRRQEYLSKLDGSKRSAANDYLYMKDVQEYMKKGGLGQKLTTGKTYEEYYDLSKDWDDFMKSVKGTVSYDEFVTNSNDPAYIQKITTEGFSKEEIASRFRSYLSTNSKAMRQLGIDTEYSLDRLGKENAYAGYTEAMKQQAESAAQQAGQYAQMVNELEAAYSRSKSPTVKSQLDVAKSRLAYYEQARNQANAEANKPYDQFDIGEYANMYQTEFINNMANMYAGQKVKKDLITNEYWKEARADARALATHQRAMQLEIKKAELERRGTFDKMVKQAQVDIPTAQTMLKNVAAGNAIPNLQAIENLALQNGDNAAATNLRDFISLMEQASTQSGSKQLTTINSAVNKLKKGSSLNAKYKAAVGNALGLSLEAYDQDGFSRGMNQLSREITNLQTAISKSKQLDPRTPMSWNYGFDYSLGSFEDMNLLLNADRLGSQFAIGQVPTSTSTKVDDFGETTTTTTTKYGEKPPKE